VYLLTPVGLPAPVAKEPATLVIRPAPDEKEQITVYLPAPVEKEPAHLVMGPAPYEKELTPVYLPAPVEKKMDLVFLPAADGSLLAPDNFLPSADGYLQDLGDV